MCRSELGAASWHDGGVTLARAFRGAEVVDEELEHGLLEAATAARATWPEIEQPAEAWAAYVGQRCPDGDLARLHSADLWAACACAAGDARAIAAVRDRCFGDLAGALRHVGATAALVDEVRAELLAQLFVGESPKITNYSGRGELRSWLRSAAIRTALKKLNAGKRTISDDALLDVVAPSDDPVLAQLKREYRDDVRSAFQAAFSELTARDRNLLRQHYIDGLTIDHLGATYSVHRATAARWLETVRVALLAGTRTRLASQLQLDTADIDSILVVIHSQLDVSFARLVGA